MGDFIMRGFNNLRGSVAERDKLVDIKTTIKLANEDGVITFEEIRESLRKWGLETLFNFYKFQWEQEN